LREDQPEVEAFHEDYAFIGVLLKKRDDVFGPTVDGQKQTHCLLARTPNFSMEAVKVTDVRKPLPPPALDKVMPAVQFERAVDLFSALVAKKRTYHRHSVRNTKPIQYVLKQITSLLRFAGR
jgi:hypothetical protein